MRVVLLNVLADRTFLVLVILGLIVQVITLYLWSRFFGLDPAIAQTSAGIFIFNLVLGVMIHGQLRPYSYLFVSIPLLLVAIDYAIVFSLR